MINACQTFLLLLLLYKYVMRTMIDRKVESLSGYLEKVCCSNIFQSKMEVGDQLQYKNQINPFD